jgi:hypothetical protein
MRAVLLKQLKTSFSVLRAEPTRNTFLIMFFVCSGMSKIKYKMNMTSGSKALGPCAEVLLKEVAPGPGIIRVALYTGFRRLLKFSNLKIAA